MKISQRLKDKVKQLTQVQIYQFIVICKNLDETLGSELLMDHIFYILLLCSKPRHI